MPTLKLPRSVFSTAPLETSPPIYAFPPNRETLGGTAYLIILPTGNVLVDCPAWDGENQTFLQAQGGVRSLFITHRGGMGKQVKAMQQQLNCEIVIQEQEAYLLPGMTVSAFRDSHELNPTCEAIWTAGHSPGSACLYEATTQTLFTGRHILPDRGGSPVPLRTAKTFHWRRQVDNVQRLVAQFSPERLRYICPGASTGFLRGERSCDRAYERLSQLDFGALMQAQPLL